MPPLMASDKVSSDAPNNAPVDKSKEHRAKIKEVYEEEAKKFAFKFKDKLDDEIYGDMVSKIQGWTRSSPPKPSSFLPVGIDPQDYFLEMSEGMKSRTNTMSDLVRKWHDDLKNRWPESAYSELIWEHIAGEWIKGFKKSRFFAEAPPAGIDAITKKYLISRAKLSLWIAWAQERQEVLGETVRGQLGASQAEARLWEPLRLELITIGVPIHIASTFTSPPVLNFPAFIEWSFSEAALNQMLAGSPLNDQSAEEIKRQWLVGLITKL